MPRSTGSCVVTVNDVLDGHTVLDLACLDRLYLSGFVQKLQTPGGVVYFLHEHRGLPIASPAVFEQISARFREGMRRFAQDNHIPVVRFRREDRKVKVMQPYLHRAAKSGRSQVAAIGVAQEFQVVWTARRRDSDPTKAPQFSFTKEQRRVTVFYVYVWDEDFGPAFIKVCLLTELWAELLHVMGQITGRVATVPARDRIRRAVTGSQCVGGASARSAAGEWGSVRALSAA